MTNYGQTWTTQRANSHTRMNHCLRILNDMRFRPVDRNTEIIARLDAERAALRLAGKRRRIVRSIYNAMANGWERQRKRRVITQERYWELDDAAFAKCNRVMDWIDTVYHAHIAAIRGEQGAVQS